MKKILAVLALLTATSSFAALAPYYESARHIQSILENPEVAQELGGVDSIVSITRRGDIYYVRAGRCTLPIRIVSLPLEPGLVGAQRFKLKVGRCQ